MFAVGEVTEIEKAFKSGQKDDNGDALPLGSIKCRVGGDHRISGNILHTFYGFYFQDVQLYLIPEINCSLRSLDKFFIARSRFIASPCEPAFSR